MTIKTANSSFGGNTSVLSRLSARTHLFSPSKMRVTIQLLDDEETVSSEFKRSATGQEILDYVCQYMDIVERDYFGLRYQDTNSKFRYWVDLTKPLSKQFSTTSSLILRLRFRFYPEDPFVLKEEITRYQLFVQLRRDLLHGRLHCSQHESATLAALILQSVLGDYSPLDHPPGYVSQYKLLLKQYDRLEEKIAELHQEFKGMVPAEAEAKFLEIAARLDTYGFDPYILKDAKQSVEIIIGVTCRGILIYLKNVKVHYLKWKDLAKVDYFGKQLRIYPTQTYLDAYHQSKDHPPLGDSLLNTTLSDTENEHDDPKKKNKKVKKTQFKMTCPTSEFAKHLWKHILSQQVFFTEDRALFVKPKFSKPRIPLLSRGSTFRCPTRRVQHEIAQEPSPPREHQPENFIRYQIPRGPPREGFFSSSAASQSKFGTMPAMHIKTRPAMIQPIEEERQSLTATKTPSSHTPNAAPTTNGGNPLEEQLLAADLSQMQLSPNLTQSTGDSSNSGIKDAPLLDIESDTEKLFAELRISTPIRSAEDRRPLRLINGDINLDDPLETEGLAKKVNGGVSNKLTNGKLANGHVTAGENSRQVAEPSTGRKLTSLFFGILLMLMLIVAVFVVAFETPSVSRSHWFNSMPFVDDIRERIYEPARTRVLTNYRRIISKF